MRVVRQSLRMDVLLLLFVSAACDNSSQEREEPEEAERSTWEEEKRIFENEVDKRVQEIERRLDRLRLTGEAKLEAEEELQNWLDYWDGVQMQLELGAARGEREWDELKRDVLEKLEELEEAHRAIAERSGSKSS